MPGPLEGFKVVDLSAVVSGPLTATLLADQGAEVIKVERTTSGDIQRNVGSMRNGFSGFFHVLNRGKRSIALDLTTTEGRDIVRRLTRDADVVVQNFRPGVVERMGVGPDVGIGVVTGNDLPGATGGGGQRHAVDGGGGGVGANREQGQDRGEGENGDTPDGCGRRPRGGRCHGRDYRAGSGWHSARST